MQLTLMFSLLLGLGSAQVADFAFHSQPNCVVSSNFESAKVGTIGACHVATHPFVSIKFESVDSGLLGRGLEGFYSIHEDCSDPVFIPLDAGSCFNTAGGENAIGYGIAQQ